VGAGEDETDGDIERTYQSTGGNNTRMIEPVVEADQNLFERAPPQISVHNGPLVISKDSSQEFQAALSTVDHFDWGGASADWVTIR
jgi:hypothetical protein